jgi:hypothetical protein
MFRVTRIEDQFEIFCDSFVCNKDEILFYDKQGRHLVEMFHMTRARVRVTTIHETSCSPSEHLECYERL